MGQKKEGRLNAEKGRRMTMHIRSGAGKGACRVGCSAHMYEHVLERDYARDYIKRRFWGKG